MAYNFVAEGFHKNKLCSRLSSSKVQFYSEKGFFSFLSERYGKRTMFIFCHWKARGGLPISVN